MLIHELGLAVAVLTRVPVKLSGAGDLSRALWAFPLVGAGVGAAGGAVMLAGGAAGVPPALAAAWALGAMVLLGGALHEDGLADLADGFGGGGSPERKLAIMRDSRIGSYGALALGLAAAIRLFAIAALAAGPIAALAVAAALARGSIAVPLLLSDPARPDGLGALMAGAGARRWVCLALAAGIAVAALPPGQALAALAAALGAALAVALLARAQVGGFTGDVLGGCAVAAECAALTALTCT